MATTVIKINAVDLDYYKNQTKPQVDLNGTFALTGLATWRWQPLALDYEKRLVDAVGQSSNRCWLIESMHADIDGASR